MLHTEKIVELSTVGGNFHNEHLGKYPFMVLLQFRQGAVQANNKKKSLV